MASLLGDSEAVDPFAGLVSTEAEQALLGAILLNNQAFEHVVDIVQARDFATPLHGRIFEAISKSLSAGGRVDAITLKTAFDQDPALAGTLSGAYLVQLVTSVVTIINAPGYARIVADLARRRDLVLAAQDLMADAADLGDTARTPGDIVGDIERRLLDIDQASSEGKIESVGDIAGRVIQATNDAYRAGGLVTIDTGLADLDRPLSGMDVGALVIVGARPSMGKTALAGTIAVNVARAGNPVLLFSLEMTREQLTQRWIAGVTGIATENQRRGRIEEHQWQALAEARSYLAELPIFVDDQSLLTVPQMRQRARRLKRRLKSKLGLVVVDHLQLVREVGRRDNRNVELGEITKTLKAMAKELECPVIVLSQLSRAVEQREDRRPMLSDLRESGSIEQDADVVMFLYRDEYYLLRSAPKRTAKQTGASFAETLLAYDEQLHDARGIAEISIPKNRTGQAGTVVKVAWNAERQQFTNLARQA